MMEEEKYPIFDGRIKHSFTCQVAGPSRSGKSTFVRNLLLHQGSVIDVVFDYILIILGTDSSVNPLLNNLRNDFPDKVTVMELNSLYSSRDEMMRSFPADVKRLLDEQSKSGREGCIVFDDLMNELSESDLLLDLFTKLSSHYKISIIYITQNVFFKGKRSGDNVTMYRNTHLLVLFRNPLDNTVLSTISKRIAPAGSVSKLNRMLVHILEKHRYVVIHGNLAHPKELQFQTELFNDEPVRHQVVYEPC